MKYEQESSDEEDRPLKSRIKKVSPQKVAPQKSTPQKAAPAKLGPPKKRAKRGEGPRMRARRENNFVKIVEYECKDCDKKFAGPTEFFDHARVSILLYIQQGYEIRSFENRIHSKTGLFDDRFSNGLVFEWSGLL